MVHEKCNEFLPERYFPLVGKVNRFPRYRNKKFADIFVAAYFEKEKIDRPKTYDLTIPEEDCAYMSFAKYGKDTPSLTDDQIFAMREAWTYVEQEFGPYMCNARILTAAEAMDKLDPTTSSGPPFNNFYPLKGELFKDEDFRSWIEEDWNRLASDENWTCLFSNSLKEEVRDASKLEQKSQRTFLASGADATVHGTRLFVDMNEKFYDSALGTSSVVGMSPFRGNWQKLYDRLKVFPNGYDIDGKQYDSSLRAWLLWGCCAFRFKMLRPEERTKDNFKRFQTFYRNLIHTLVVAPDGELMLKQLGNPSGSVNTISDNTLILAFLLAYTWIRKAPKMMCNYDNYREHLEKALQGDDNTWTVSDLAHQFFNAKSVMECWGELGVTATTDVETPRPIDQLKFLSASFGKVNGDVVPVYDYDKLVNSLYYCPSEKHNPIVTLNRAAALRMVGWYNSQFRTVVDGLILDLIEKFDSTLKHDRAWLAARASYHPPYILEKLYRGTVLTLAPQCRRLERFIKLHKNIVSMNSNKNTVVSAPVRKNAPKKKKQNQAKKQRPVRRAYARPSAPPTVIRPRPSRKLQYTMTKKTIEDCTLLYAKVLTNPFDNSVQEACIPDTVCVPSYKFSTTAQSTFTIGTQGIGYVAFNPWAMCAGNWANAASVNPPLVGTSATYSSDQYVCTTALALAGDIVVHNSNSFFSEANIKTGEIRLVGAGVEIFYTGKVLEQSGIVVSLQNDGLKPFPNNTSISALQINPRSVTCSVSSKERCYLTYTPTDHKVTSYAPITDYIAEDLAVPAFNPLLMMVSGAEPGTTFQFRARAFFEAQLPGMSVSPSHADPQGMAKVLELKTMHPVTTDPTSDSKKLILTLLRNAGESLARAAPYVGSAVGAAFGQPNVGLAVGTTTKSVLDALLRN